MTHSLRDKVLVSLHGRLVEGWIRGRTGYPEKIVYDVQTPNYLLAGVTEDRIMPHA